MSLSKHCRIAIRACDLFESPSAGTCQVESWELSKVETRGWRAVDGTSDCELKIAPHSLSDYVAMRLRPLSVRPRLTRLSVDRKPRCGLPLRRVASRRVVTTALFCPTHRPRVRIAFIPPSSPFERTKCHSNARLNVIRR